jgi:hypothetical protein
MPRRGPRGWPTWRNHAEREETQLAAIREILDRGLGRAVQPVVSDMTVTHMRPIQVVSPSGAQLPIVDIPDEEVE